MAHGEESRNEADGHKKQQNESLGKRREPAQGRECQECFGAQMVWLRPDDAGNAEEEFGANKACQPYAVRVALSRSASSKSHTPGHVLQFPQFTIQTPSENLRM